MIFKMETIAPTVHLFIGVNVEVEKGKQRNLVKEVKQGLTQDITTNVTIAVTCSDD